MTFSRTEAFQTSDGRLFHSKSEAKTHEIQVCEARLSDAVEGHLHLKYDGEEWNEHQIAQELAKHWDELTKLVRALEATDDQEVS